MGDTADRILLVDDDDAFRKVYAPLLRSEGFEVDQADDRDSARQAFEARRYAVVLLDLMLPPDGSVRSGIAMLAEFLEKRPDAKIVVVSGAGDRGFMVDAVREGAYDFLTKPVDPDVLAIVVQRAATRARLERRVEGLQTTLATAAPSETMIGDSPSFTAARTLAERVAPTDLPVLVTGENGTGKELLARSVHQRSKRAAKPFVAINCGALPETLLESTLFGHVRGAFTGASANRDGLFVEADGGTLFLDEVGDMPLPLQVKLLRVLENGELYPVGADRSRTVDVRIVSATNRDLDALMADGAFREDLYWRIKGTEVVLPPLRERPSDIPTLAAHFLNVSASLAPNGRAKTLSEDARRALVEHDWPGNLRELRHEMQRATVLSGDRTVIEATDFGFAAAGGPRGAADTLQARVEGLERREIAAALARHEGNRTRVAEELGLSRQGLLNKINRYEL